MTGASGPQPSTGSIRDANLSQERTVGVEPVDVVELAGRQPADLVVLGGLRFTIDEPGDGDSQDKGVTDGRLRGQPVR